MTQKKPITIQAGHALVIDDEPANRDFLERLLQTASFKVSGAATGAEGLSISRTLPSLALALVDQELPDASGLEIIAKLRAENPDSLLVMATMHDDRALIDQAFVAGIDVFLVKPHGFMELYRRLQEVDANTELLRNVIIDQYGPRPYKGADKRTTSEAKATVTLEAAKPAATPVAPAATVSAAAAPETPAVTPAEAPAAPPVVAPAAAIPASEVAATTAPVAPTTQSKDPLDPTELTIMHKIVLPTTPDKPAQSASPSPETDTAKPATSTDQAGEVAPKAPDAKS